ncbi:MAG: site-2 protease family protein [Acutalibacter sp.]|nr:site-2 protease family protein [Acutalibacter sp.]
MSVAFLIVIGILLFGFVVFFHELGHFLLAKSAGIWVREFSLGMGPQLFSFTKGDTKYALRLLPIGGYCMMEGEDESSTDERAFSNKPVWRRILVVVAGGVFNIILGFVLMLFVVGQQNVYSTTQIAKFTENSGWEAAGAQAGDTIVEIDGFRIYTERDLSFALSMADPASLSAKVRRDGKILELDPITMQQKTDADGNSVLAIDFYIQGEAPSFLGLIRKSALDTFSMTRLVVESLKGLITGRFGFNELAGPVGTAQMITQVTSEGLAVGFGQALQNLVLMIIVITVNLGIVNLLPLPALDGGRLLFLIWEGVTRKPVPKKYEAYIHAAGFVLLILLMVAVTFGDIRRLIFG